MTEDVDFKPTLDVPIAWIEELAGVSFGRGEALTLSYFPNLPERLGELDCSIDDVEEDFGGGYVAKLNSGPRGEYVILESVLFTIWANPIAGKATGASVLALGKIDRSADPTPLGRVALRGLRLRPIQIEEPASAAELLTMQKAYWDAHRELESPPKYVKPVPSVSDDEVDLPEYQAFADLLEVLRRVSKHGPRPTVSGTVTGVPKDQPADDDEGGVLRVETGDDLRGWKDDTRVQGSFGPSSIFSGKVRRVEGSVVELESLTGALPSGGSPVTVVQEPHFRWGAHKRALAQFLDREVAGEWENLRALLAEPGALVPGDSPPVGVPSYGKVRLTEEQQRAVDGAVATPHTFFIQGPPGTGKTTVITEIVQRLVARGERVLLLSSTHVAVDEVLRRIEKKDGVLPVRLTWDTDKVDAELRQYAYRDAVRGLVKKVLKPKEDPDNFWAERRAARDGALQARVDDLRGLEENWVAGGKEPGAEEALKEEIGAALLAAANFICGTTVGVANKMFSHIGNVDTLIIDEASRVTDVELLIGAVRAKRWILVGDEHQLPPYVDDEAEQLLLGMVARVKVERRHAADLREAVEQLAREWEEDEEIRPLRIENVVQAATTLLSGTAWVEHYRWPFSDALSWYKDEGMDDLRELVRTVRYFLVQGTFERAVSACPGAMRVRLSEQRRMIDPIARIVREPVYKGAYRSPAPELLAKDGVTPLVCGTFSMPVTLLNTEARGKEAADELRGTGFVNLLEVEWIVHACDRLEAELPQGSRPTVSILCFYREQSRLIRAEMDNKPPYQKLDFRVINAIDRIQGQESDIVFISFCRARSPKRPIGPRYGTWLQDVRRLNVAFTRARRALILVGHLPTLRRLGDHQAFYKHLLGLFQQYPDEMEIVQDFGRGRGRR